MQRLSPSIKDRALDWVESSRSTAAIQVTALLVLLRLKSE
jgi:hypothetical protein